MMSSKRSSSTSLSAAAEIIQSNDDLLIEILERLPATSIVKFKVVNKRWRSLISAPLFSRRHTVIHQHGPESEPGFILSNSWAINLVCNPTTLKLSPLFPPGFPTMEMVQSCNGLLLLRCMEGKHWDSYYVFNPTTMQQRGLFPLPPGYVCDIYLMFDPSLSPYYRVVCFMVTENNWQKRELSELNIFLYDSESHEWKGGDEVVDSSILDVHRANNFNGGIYFYRQSCASSAHFIPEGNVIKIIPNPPDHNFSGIKTMESNGYLLCLTLSRENGSHRLHVYEMKGIDSGWSNKFEANIDSILGKNCIDCMVLLGVIRGERIKDSLLLFRLRDKVMIYRFCDKVCDVVDYKEKRMGFVSGAHHFIHSLAPV